METQSIKPRYSREEMISLIGRWKSSGLSQSVFCKEHKVTYSLFQYWYGKIKKEARSDDSGFVEIKVKPSAILSHPIEIIFPSGARIILSTTNVDAPFIRSLVY